MDLNQLAEQAARRAGEILRADFRQAHTVEFKGAIDIVTQVDRASEICIVDCLRESTPDYTFLTEEETVSRTAHDSCWIIDPLDGTLNYARGIPRFCVSIALEQRGVLEVGVIYDPLCQELYSARRGHGATLNGAPIQTSTRRLPQAVLSTGYPYDAWTNEDDNLTATRYFIKRAMTVRSTGSAALDLAYVACGRYDGHWERGLKAYDIAAGTLLVREAGGVVTNYAGNEDVLGSQETIAANRPVHAELLAYLSGAVR
ncbi:MAG: inositol monophosphatase [Anaerolineae bacterium]|nr:inositol monophosphatase [Anaerolineae bacterium]